MPSKGMTMASSDMKMPDPIGYASKTGHGTYFREALTTELRALEWAGRPMWTPLYDEPTVRRLIAEAVEREREACAALCVKIERAGGHGLCPASGFTFAASIRNRSKA